MILKNLFVIFIYFLSLTSGCSQNLTIQENCAINQCTIVVDAGSTGSKLHVYSSSSLSSPQINELYVKRIQPGIASLSRTQSDMNEYLSQLFQGLDVKNISLYFYATGGMRLHSQAEQEQYLELLRNWFAQHPQYQLLDARVISGREEGVFGWLAINNALTHSSGADVSSVGVLDIGGASTQLVFPVQNTQNLAPDDLVSAKVNNHKVNLFSHSFLGLGSTEVVKRFQDQVLCMPQNYPISNYISGSGDAYACEQLIANKINEDYGINQRISKVVATNTVDRWYTLGSVSALIKNKPFVFSQDQITAQSLIEQGDRSVCHADWAELHSQYFSNEYMKNNCLLSAYYYALTVDSYTFNPSQPVYIMPTQDEQDWSVGVLLFHIFHNDSL